MGLIKYGSPKGGGGGGITRGLRKVLPTVKICICAVYDYTGRADLSNGSPNSLFGIIVALARMCFSLVDIDCAKIPLYWKAPSYRNPYLSPLLSPPLPQFFFALVPISARAKSEKHTKPQGNACYTQAR